MFIPTQRLSGFQPVPVPHSKSDQAENKTLDQYDPESRLCFLQTLRALGTSGRLFIQGEHGLQRAEPMQVKEQLDRGLPVELVTSYASESYVSREHASREAQRSRGLFSAGYDHFHRGTKNEEIVKTVYGTSPFRSWDSLFFATPGEGVRGVPVLPRSGNRVTVSYQFEQSHLSISNEQWGFLEDNNFSQNSQGLIRQTMRPTEL